MKHAKAQYQQGKISIDALKAVHRALENVKVQITIEADKEQ